MAEKCQDGWYKGTCLRTGRSGVFPGNYVQMVRLSAAMKSSMANALLASLGAGRSPGNAVQHSVIGRTQSFPKTSPHHKAAASSKQEHCRSQSQGTVKLPSRTITNVTTVHTRTVQSAVASTVASASTTTATTSTTNASARVVSPRSQRSGRESLMTTSLESGASAGVATTNSLVAGIFSPSDGATNFVMDDNAMSYSPKPARRHKKHERSKHLSLTSSPRQLPSQPGVAVGSSCSPTVASPASVASPGGVTSSPAVRAAAPAVTSVDSPVADSPQSQSKPKVHTRVKLYQMYQCGMLSLKAYTCEMYACAIGQSSELCISVIFHYILSRIAHFSYGLYYACTKQRNT